MSSSLSQNQSPHGPGQWDDPWKRWEATAHEPEHKSLSKAAVTSLVFGLLGGVLFAWVFGGIGLAVTGRNGSRRGRGLAWAGIALATLWAVALAALLVLFVQRQPDRDASGQVSGAGTATVFDLRAGDCLRDPGGSGEITEAAVVPCTQPHLGQVVVTVRLGDGAYDLARVQSEAEQMCRTSAPPALSADAPKDLQLFTLVPDQRAVEPGRQARRHLRRDEYDVAHQQRGAMRMIAVQRASTT